MTSLAGSAPCGARTHAPGTRTRSRGMSMVEVLVATMILGAALLPMLTVLSTSSRESSFDAAQVTAQGLALSLVESAVGELSITNYKSIDRTEVVTAGVGVVKGGFEAHVKAVPADSSGWLWTVSVDVRWTLIQDVGPAGGGGDHRLRLERLVSRPDSVFTGKFPYRKKGAQ